MNLIYWKSDIGKSHKNKRSLESHKNMFQHLMRLFAGWFVELLRLRSFVYAAKIQQTEISQTAAVFVGNTLNEE
jgi:hypothetical protein